MENENRQINWEIFPISCSRCWKMIHLQERFISLYFSLETPNREDSVDTLESHMLSQLCFDCAGVMLTEATVNKK